jgi:hypothetical protein
MFSTAAVARAKIQAAKRKNRGAKAASVRTSRVAALPKIPRVILEANYVNPITLDFPKNMVVYEIKNRTTGRTNYYNKATFRKLITAFKNNYNLLMMNPKVPIPGAKNPMTRGPIYPRNVRRVTVATKKKTPSPNTAAKKIQSAVRKHLSKKRKTPSPSKSKSKSRSK